ncbi:hypothetical protein [Halomicrobium salinisoli]|uniref:hypothetical protein n=1 Tax=Halomicrobium salinisoli TaxID=2878391 RepID=UPI001CEFB869|nr:hypothetical protein [Halomicrobium salinisoli]
MNWSRRRALSALAGGLAASVAGCAGSGDDGPPSPDARDRQRTVEDYELERVRSTDAAVLFTQADELPTPVESDDRRSGRPAGTHEHVYVVSGDDLDDLTFGDVPEAARLREFAAATDFESASVYLFSTPVSACHEIRVQSIALRADGDPDGDFCRATLPADVECGTDDFDTVGLAIRLPVAQESVSGHSAGTSSSCRRPPGRVAFEATVTPTDGGDGS